VRPEGPPLACLFVGLLFALGQAAAQTPPAPTPAPAAATPAPHIAWETDFDAALLRAQTEKKPLFVAFLMDDEYANDLTIKEHYTHPEIVELTTRFVCLVCCIGEHRGEEPGCAKFRGITCAQHQAIEKKARARWLVGDVVTTPQHVFCDSKGEVVLRKIYLIPKESLAKCLMMTLQTIGCDITGLKFTNADDKNPSALVDKEKQEVDGWLRDLDSNNLQLRETALRGLGYADDARAFPALLRRCDPGQDEMTRLAAISALARKGNYEAVKPLTAMLKEAKAPIVIRAALALETIQLPEAVPALMAIAKKERKDRVLGVLLRAAARSQGSNVEVRDLCLKSLKQASNQLEGSVMVALGHLDPHAKIADAMAPLIKSKTQNTRALAVWVLGAQRTPESRKVLEAMQRDEKSPEISKLLESAVKNCRGEAVQGYESLYGMFHWGTDY